MSDTNRHKVTWSTVLGGIAQQLMSMAAKTLDTRYDRNEKDAFKEYFYSLTVAEMNAAATELNEERQRLLVSIEQVDRTRGLMREIAEI